MRTFYLIIALVLGYFLLQFLWTGYFYLKSKALLTHTHTGNFKLGNPKNPAFTILVDGDSVGAGIGASTFEKSLAGRIGNYFVNKHYVTLQNNAVVGYRMKDLVDKKLPNKKFDLTVLVISSNDLFHLTDMKDFKTNTALVLDRYSKISGKVIVIGPGRVFDARAIPLFMRPIYRVKGNDYAELLYAASVGFPNVTHVNPLGVSIDHHTYGDTNAVDGFHPNDEGHRYWFDLLKTRL